jgi:hypothetical protein
MAFLKKLLLPVSGLFLLGFVQNVQATSQTLSLPLTIEYPLIRSVLISQVYTQPGEKAVFLDKKNRCVRIELWEPEVRPDESVLVLWSRMKLQAGLPVGKGCLRTLDWEGYVAIQLKPNWNSGDWRLHFKTQDINFYNLQHEKKVVAKIIWRLIARFVQPPLDQVSLNLAPPVKDTVQLLPLFIKPEEQERFKKSLESLRPGALKIGPAAVAAEMLVDADLPEKQKTGPVPQSLSESEKVEFIKNWEVWDAFLVHELLALVGQTLTPEEKGILLKILLETRYGFLETLERPAPDRDLVRDQFLKSWSEVGPIFRKHLPFENSPSLILYMGYFTALDALKILDQVGGTFGLEIGQEGLIRLARLVNRGQTAWAPDYSFAVDPELRKVLGLGDPIVATGPAFEEEELELDRPAEESSLSFQGSRWPIRSVSTAPKDTASSEAAREIKQWIPDESNIEEYLDRVEKVLSQASQKVLDKNNLEQEYHSLFRMLVSATAWQESCWRQLTVSQGKVRPLISYNGTSVGLMQINVRVWRGLYEPKALRWNIHYNVRAGTEILELYLRRYALNRSDQRESLASDRLSGAVYAIYQGGPDGLDRFLKRSREGRLNAYDRLFLKKYEWVKEGELNRIQICITGKES